MRSPLYQFFGTVRRFLEQLEDWPIRLSPRFKCLKDCRRFRIILLRKGDSLSYDYYYTQVI